jgi:hypothetical protein
VGTGGLDGFLAAQASRLDGNKKADPGSAFLSGPQVIKNDANEKAGTRPAFCLLPVA